MKKTTILLILASSFFPAIAQTEKNNWLVGGSIGYTSSSQKESGAPQSDKTAQFQIAPDLGYFIINNLALGIDIDFTSIRSEAGIPDQSYTSRSFTAGPFARYYISTGKRAKIFIHGNAEWGSYKLLSGTIFNPGTSLTLYECKAGPVFFLNTHAALELAVGLQYMKSNYSVGSMVSNTINIGLGFQIHLGRQKNKNV